MPALTGRQICTTALRLIGVAASEQPISADMAESALDALNTMLDAWSTERVLTYTRPKIALVLVPSRATYTWGISTPPADIPREPPVRLELVQLLVDDTAPGLEWPLTILTQTEYETGVYQKTLTSSYPWCVYLETSQPVAVLHLWPVPDQGYTLHLLPWQAHSPYASYDAVLDWPQGYQRAFQFNLALELAAQYGVEPSPLIVRTAEESKRALSPINAEVGRLSLNPRRPAGSTALGYPRGFREGWG